MAMNKLTTIGRLVADPEAKHAGNYDIVEFRMASTTATKERDSDDYISNFYTVTVWSKNKGDYIMKYIKKGDMVAVSGDLTVRNFKKTDGTTATSLNVTSNDVELLRRKGDGNGTATQNTTHTSQPAPSAVDPDDLPF